MKNTNKYTTKNTERNNQGRSNQTKVSFYEPHEILVDNYIKNQYRTLAEGDKLNSEKSIISNR